MPTAIRERLLKLPRVRRLIQEQSIKPKFSKRQSYYVGRTKIAVVRCENCVYFTPPDKCALVSEEGAPTPGVIASQGACSLWNGNTPRINVFEVAYGRAESKGVLPQIIRNRIIDLRWSLDESLKHPRRL